MATNDSRDQELDSGSGGGAASTSNAPSEVDALRARAHGLERENDRLRRSEAILRDRERYLRSVLAAAPVVLWALDLQGLFTLSEGRGLSALGLKPGQVVGQSVFDVYRSEAEVLRQVRRGLAGEEFDGETYAAGRHWNTFYVTLRDDNGVQVGMLGISVDITDRKRAEAALDQERRRLAAILEGTDAGTWEWHVQTGEVVFNETWARFVGYTLEELSPTSIDTWARLAHPDDLKASNALLERHFRGELELYECESRMRHKDGSWIWVLDKGKVTRWTDDGRPLLMAGTHQEITARKRAEEAARQLETQLQHAQKLESIGRLAGGVAHDFNNMLGVIIGHAELAMAQVDEDGPVHGDLMAIRAAAERSADLTRQLLAFARRQPVTPKVLDLNGTVPGVLGMLGRLVGENIAIAWHPGPGLWPVKVDPSQIDQILANLCVNARDAISGAGRVAVETENCVIGDEHCAKHPDADPGDHVRLTVSDTGCGIEPGALAHVFEPFFTTKGFAKGTGLGLATVYGIVRQNGGFVDVSSEPGRGSTFKIYLPRHRGSESLVGRHAEPATPRGNETILLVEDEPANLAMVAKMLERHGYTVIPAQTPREAIRLASECTGAIHLLLTDVVMPEMNGRELARHLQGSVAGLKVLFTSGYTADVIAHHGVLDEGTAFIQKPFSSANLRAKVREVLGGEPA
jgi:two-component system, cell cycle sensor histidine kinase and response regulator CckA